MTQSASLSFGRDSSVHTKTLRHLFHTSEMVPVQIFSSRLVLVLLVPSSQYTTKDKSLTSPRPSLSFPKGVPKKDTTLRASQRLHRPQAIGCCCFFMAWDGRLPGRMAGAESWQPHLPRGRRTLAVRRSESSPASPRCLIHSRTSIVPLFLRQPKPSCAPRAGRGSSEASSVVLGIGFSEQARRSASVSGTTCVAWESAPGLLPRGRCSGHTRLRKPDVAALGWPRPCVAGAAGRSAAGVAGRGVPGTEGPSKERQRKASM